ncbi:hypothetical protein ACDA63_17005 [Uliginosibacterium sp. sgz301328]|uniref:hypothetical protein n=1 Tax=Uliginosibacterium sp. sgz301328 TaxID=3243764 RepID=UPI00359E9B8F
MKKNTFARTGSALLLSLFAAATLTACGDDDDNGNDAASSSTSSSSSSKSSSSSSSSSSSASSVSSSDSSSVSSSASSSVSSSTAAAAFFDAADLDAQGWFAFNDETKGLKYIVGATPDGSVQNSWVMDGTQAATGQQFIYGYPNTLTGTDAGNARFNAVKAPGTDTSLYTMTGAIDLPKAGAASDYASGGSVVFKLPSCSSFVMTVAATGDIYYQVSTSSDGINWTSKFMSPTDKASKLAKGTYEQDITQYATSTTPIYVKITGGRTGSLYIHRVKIKQ